MTLDWQAIATLMVGVAQIVVVVRAYYGLQSATAALSARVEVALLTERAMWQSEHLIMKGDALRELAVLEGAVKDISTRVTNVESGADEWTKSLRARTHQLADQLNMVLMKIDRLEQRSQGIA